MPSSLRCYKYLIVAVVMLFMPWRAVAQWSGSMDAKGGMNFKKFSNNEALKASVGYKSDKYHVGTDVYGGHSYKPRHQTITVADEAKEGSEYLKQENKELNPREWNAGTRVRFGYNMNARNVLELDAGYDYKGNGSTPSMLTQRWSYGKELNGTQYDTTAYRCHAGELKLYYEHLFEDTSKRISLLTGNSFAWGEEVNSRITDGNFYSKPKRYRTFSSINDYDNVITLTYDDKQVCGVHGLELSTGLNLLLDTDLDMYYGDNFVRGQWRDSTALDQSYLYCSLSLEPFISLKYSIGKFEFSIKERLQWYRHSLMDKLDEKYAKDQYGDLFVKNDLKNPFAAAIVYKMSDKHSFGLDFDHSIYRPDYMKLCKTWTIGKSEGEYYTGNPDLRPETRHKFNLKYRYETEIFKTEASVHYTNRRNTVEKVLEIIPKEKEVENVRTLYTWANTQRQDEVGARLQSSANVGCLKTDMWAVVNYEKFQYKEKDAKEDANFELGMQIEAQFSRDVTLSGNLAYLSPKESAFNYIGERVVANLKLLKRFRKGFEVYVEARDLADKEIYEETLNKSRTNLKITETTPYGRTFLVGLTYKF